MFVFHVKNTGGWCNHVTATRKKDVSNTVKNEYFLRLVNKMKKKVIQLYTKAMMLSYSYAFTSHWPAGSIFSCLNYQVKRSNIMSYAHIKWQLQQNKHMQEWSSYSILCIPKKIKITSECKMHTEMIKLKALHMREVPVLYTHLMKWNFL